MTRPEHDLRNGVRLEQYDISGRLIEAWHEGRRRTRREAVADIAGWLALNHRALTDAEINAGIEAAELNRHEASYAIERAREMVAELAAGGDPYEVAAIRSAVPKKYQHLPPMPWMEKRRARDRDAMAL